MPKKLLENISAEKEANDVGMRYMNSSDVLQDMRRDYGSAVDGIKVHDDSIANAKVTEAGRDGIASGKDIYMREGSLSSHRPEVNGLLAHEVTHVMQQSNGAHSVSYGDEQGGLFDWFKGLFGKKKKEEEPEPDIQISEPQLVSHLSVSQVSELDQQFAADYAKRLASAKKHEKSFYSPKATAAARKTASMYGATPEEQEEIHRYSLNDEAQHNDSLYNFNDLSSLVLYQMMRDNGGQWAKSSLAQTMVTSDFNQNIRQRLKDVKGSDLITQRGIFRGNDVGELGTVNLLSRKMLPEGYLDSLTDIGDGLQDQKQVGQALVDKITGDMGEGGSLTGIADMLSNTRSAFSGSDYFDSDEEASAMMMNNFVLRGLNGAWSQQAADLRAQSTVAQGRGMDMTEKIIDPAKRAQSDKINSKSVAIMKSLAAPFGKDETRKSANVFQALRDRMRRKRS